MGRFLRALAWAAAFAVPAALAYYAGYAVTGNLFRERAVPFPFERFGVAVGAASAFWALGAVCLIRHVFRMIANQRSHR